MTASDMLTQQQAWLDLLQKTLEDPRPATLTAVTDTRDQQLVEVQSRIQDLAAQKDAAIQRFDTAIAEHQRALSVLQSAVGDTGPALPNATPTPSRAPLTPPDTTPLRRSKRASRATPRP